MEHLPWRIAAAAGLLVGAASLWAGVDLCAALLRVAIAFAVFGLIGLGLRLVLQIGTTGDSTADSSVAHRMGARVDQTTPPMSVEDVSKPVEGGGRRGDDKE